MVTSADSALLRVWETARGQSLPRRTAALLALACPEAAPDALTALAPGEAQRRLLQLRAQYFAPQLACVAQCASCGETLEFAIDGRALAAELPAAGDALPVLGPAGETWRVALRAPTLSDCIAAADAADPELAYRTLLERCVVPLASDGARCAVETLPAELVDAADAALAAANAAAECRLALHCPACGQQTDAPLDIAAFCWAEIEARAPRLLAEVHQLASRYGWREADILAMSRLRRDHYLGLVAS